jgi:hypothetical protein
LLGDRRCLSEQLRPRCMRYTTRAEVNALGASALLASSGMSSGKPTDTGRAVAERRREREPEMVELTWHDCFGQVTPSDEVMADIVVLSDGTLEGWIRAGHLAVINCRDLRVAADFLRARA